MIESLLRTERGRVATLEQQLHEERLARQTAEARADEWARRYREAMRRPDAPSFFDREDDGAMDDHGGCP